MALNTPRLLQLAAAFVTALGVGTAFGTVLFGAPALTRVREQALELGVLPGPTLAALALMAVLVAAQRFSVLLRAGGYPIVAAGALLGGLGLGMLDERAGGPDVVGTWFVVASMGGAVALAGLTLLLGDPAARVRVAMGAGLALGIAYVGPVATQAANANVPHYLLAVLTGGVAVAGAALHRTRTAQAPQAGARVVIVVAVAGMVVMAGLLARGVVLGVFRPSLDLARPDLAGTMTYVLLGLAALVALAFAVVAARAGGPRLAVWPVLAFVLAAPLTPVALGFSVVAQYGWPPVIAGIALAAVAGAVLAWRAGAVPWEVLGVLPAYGGLVMMSGGEVRHFETAYVLLVCGCSFALAAGLVRAARLPKAAFGIGLGLATWLLTAQALGPFTIDLLLPFRAAPANATSSAEGIIGG
ncbi:MAG TPA: hypothetical protein VF062_20120 [Candidatus Limnocylindrales bacterium]